VAISFLFLQELGYFDEKKGTDKKREVHDEESTKESSKSSGEDEHNQK
jgi:hypothetical protein